MKISKTQAKLFIFLKQAEERKKQFTIEELISATGWKKITFDTYWQKGQLSDFINKVDDTNFESFGCNNITEIEFVKMLSQSKHRRGLGHNCKSKLAKSLLIKAKDNFQLSIELYNRPSLENRMDVFVMCFCAAWEQFLKAVLIEQDGEDSIFKKAGKKGIKETISLRDCLATYYAIESNIRKNIEKIVYIRDQAVHLLIPEIQSVTSRIFQSGVLNFTSEFESFTEIPIVNSNHAGMLSIVGEFKLPPLSVMKANYGDMADDILELATSLQDEIEKNNAIEFAIPLKVSLVYATDNGETLIKLAKAEDGIEGLKKALFIEKPIDRAISHPYLRSKAITEINKLLRERFIEDKLSKHLVCQDKTSNKYCINSNCFEAVIDKNKWKNSNNQFHYKNKDPELHYYSYELVNEFIKKIMEHEGYLSRAKTSYNKRK
ncbi:DUF3644 domain-containing protein [Utexia brackfieldae]|uniref:DUF3644 domain-containing protein n=1 Tax=Utexia brackfieldae TaxID=3074108 RepID=UPI00370D5B6B